MRVRPAFLRLLLLTGVVALCCGCGDLDGAPAAHAQTPPRPSAARIPTDTSPSTPPFVAPAIVAAAKDVRIHPYVDGSVARVLVRPGDTVQAGDLLVELSSPELVELVAEARAKLAQAEALARLEDISRRITAVEAAAAAGEWEADYDGAVASLERTQFDSVRTIHNQQSNMAFTLADVERGETDLDRARNQLTHAQLQREATKARGASLGISLAKSEREKQRMEELQSKNFASSSSVEEAQLEHATAVTASEEHTQDLAARDEDVKAALEEIASSERLIAIWADALGHKRKALEALRQERAARELEAELIVRKTGARRDATRANVDLDAEKSARAAEAAAAAVREAAAALSVAEQQVSWLRVTAPVAGIVTGVSVAVGELARSGRTTYASETPLLTLGDSAQLVAELTLPSSRLVGIGLGAAVRVSLTGAPGSATTEASGEVSAKVSSVRPHSRNADMYVVTVDISQPPAGIALGSVVLVQFE